MHAALSAQIPFIQYRDKQAHSIEKRRVALKIAALTCNTHTTFIINDDLTLAQTLLTQGFTCGLHVGKTDTSITSAHNSPNRPSIIGASCYNNLDRALIAQQQGADYVSFGALFPSLTKPNAKRATLVCLKHAKQYLSCPIIAIGGITPELAPAVISAGANYLAVAHALNHASAFNKTLMQFINCF